MRDDRSLLRRVFTIPNQASMLAGVGILFVLASWWDSYLGGLWAAVVAGTVASFVWLLWIRLMRTSTLHKTLSEPQLGAVPITTTSPTPTITDPGSAAAAAYRSITAELEAVAGGQVLLISGAAPGHGSSTVALNMAISATLEGRRVVLVDGDLAGNGLSRFGRTGSGPGLIDLARGDVELAEASRMWTLASNATLPFIPSGTSNGEDADALRGQSLAAAVDRITEHADLVLIDIPPLEWNGTSAALAAHADGVVLVVSAQSDLETVHNARDRLAEIGAPVVAHIVNRAGVDTIHPTPPWRRMIKRGVIVGLLSLLVFAAWNGYQVWDSWRSVERDTLDVAAAQSILPLPPGGIAPDVAEELPEETQTVVTAPPTDEATFASFLVVGSDEGGNRADVIILVLFGASEVPVMVSIPRDLYLPNRCTQGFTRINATYLGCGDEVNGATLLALAVEDFTGIPVDHFALFDFDGFEAIIDEVGGIEICVDHAVRDRNARLDLPAGCTNATGGQALAWVRSRSTQELRDGVWRTMGGVNDLTRNERQQDVILAMFAKLRAFDSPTDLTTIVDSVSEAFTLDDQLGIGDAISLAWSLRDLDPATVTRIEIPVTSFRTADGASVLLPTQSFDELLAEAFPELDDAVA